MRHMSLLNSFIFWAILIDITVDLYFKTCIYDSIIRYKQYIVFYSCYDTQYIYMQEE